MVDRKLETSNLKPQTLNIFGTPDERMFRKMGFYGDQSGIIKRYLRERENWEPHLQNTRRFALQAMRGKERKSAAVLGSGWLLDVPIEEFARRFEKVYLFDIRHPASVKKQIRALKNVELRECDISEFAYPTCDYAKRYRNKKDRPPVDSVLPKADLDFTGFDFVFSCNILNQLDILLVDYLSEYFSLNDEETLSFRKNIQQHHVDMLPCGKSCIVADCEEIVYDKTGREISRKQTVHCPTIFSNAERWTWKFDTRMTYYAGKKTCFSVSAAEK